MPDPIDLAENDPDLTLGTAEERLVVSKREVTGARVRVSTHVTAFEQLARASLETDRVVVTRVPIDRIVEGERPTVREIDGVTVVPVFEEILVVEKRLLLKEELHIRRSTTTDDVEIPVSLRRMTAEVERIPPEEPAPVTVDQGSRPKN